MLYLQKDEADPYLQICHRSCTRMRRRLGEAHQRQDFSEWHFPVRLPTTAFLIKSHLTGDSKNVTVPHSVDRVDPGSLRIQPNEDLLPAPIDSIYDKWFFISGAAV